MMLLSLSEMIVDISLNYGKSISKQKVEVSWHMSGPNIPESGTFSTFFPTVSDFQFIEEVLGTSIRKVCVARFLLMT